MVYRSTNYGMCKLRFLFVPTKVRGESGDIGKHDDDTDINNVTRAKGKQFIAPVCA
jgi:hypothetical protein